MTKAAIVGGGDLAAGWAARFLLNGWDVSVTHDDSLAPVLEQARRVLPMLYECALPEEGRLVENDIADADCIVLTEPCVNLPEGIPVLAVTNVALPVYLYPLIALESADPEASAILAEIGMAPGEPGLLHMTETEVEARDRVLVALLRALKRENAGAGRVIAAHEQTLDQSTPATGPLVTVRRVIPSDWTDYNGHMNESRYGQIWSDAADKVLLDAGLDEAYLASGGSYFTAETKTNFLNETMAGEPIVCETKVTLVDGKKLRVFHEMKRAADGELLATCDQFLLHVSLETRRSSPPDPAILARLEAMRERRP